MQDAFHVLCRFLLHDLLSFMSQSRTVGNTVLYISLLRISLKTMFLRHTKLPKMHTSVLREN